MKPISTLNWELTNEELNQRLYTDAEFAELYARDKAYIEIQNQNQNLVIVSVIQSAQVEELPRRPFKPKIFEWTVQARIYNRSPEWKILTEWIENHFRKSTREEYTVVCGESIAKSYEHLGIEIRDFSDTMEATCYLKELFSNNHPWIESWDDVDNWFYEDRVQEIVEEWFYDNDIPYTHGCFTNERIDMDVSDLWYAWLPMRVKGEFVYAWSACEKGSNNGYDDIPQHAGFSYGLEQNPHVLIYFEE